MKGTAKRPAKEGSSSDHIDARVRAVRRKRARRHMPRLLWLLPAGAVSLLLCAMMTANYTQYRRYQKQADFKGSQLSALQQTQSALAHRLAFLQLPKGRDQILLEHGFVKSGQRYLQFSETKSSLATAPQTANATSDDAPVGVDKDAGGNAWQNAADTLSGWLSGLKGVQKPR